MSSNDANRLVFFVGVASYVAGLAGRGENSALDLFLIVFGIVLMVVTSYRGWS